MKNLFFVLFFISSSAFGQSFLYNLYLGYDPIAQRGYCGNATYDALTTEWTIINAWSDSDIHAFGDHTVDPVNNRWYQVYGDSLNMYLLMIDMGTGDTLKQLFTVDSVGDGTTGTVTIGGNINGCFYNCIDNSVYFMHYKAPYEDSVHLAKVNVMDYTVTEIESFPISYYAIDNSVSPGFQSMFLLYYDYQNNVSKIFTYDLQSNSLSSVNISQPNFNATELLLTIDPINGMPYGVDYDLDSFAYNNYLGTITGVSLDPVTGQLDFLTPEYYSNILGSNVSFHSLSSGDDIYFLAMNSNPSYFQVLGDFDLTTNTISFDTVFFTNAPFGFPTPFGLDAYNPDDECPVASYVNDPIGKCNVALLPDPSSNQILIQSDCDLTQYSELQLQVFDMLGRKVFDGAVDGNEERMRLELARSAVYVYRLSDGGRVISSGKFLVMN